MKSFAKKKKAKKEAFLLSWNKIKDITEKIILTIWSPTLHVSCILLPQTTSCQADQMTFLLSTRNWDQLADHNPSGTVPKPTD